MFLALIPVFRVMSSKHYSRKQLLLFAFAFNWLLGMGVHVWVYFPAVEFGQYPVWVGILLIGVFGLFSNIEVWVAGCVAALLPPKRKRLAPMVFVGVLALFSGIPATKMFLWSLADALIQVDWMSPVFFFSGRVGALALMLFFAQWLDVAGSWVVQRKWANLWAAMPPAFAVLVLLVGMFGFRSWIDAREFQDGETLDVLMVQANIGNAMKLDAKHGLFPVVDRIIKTYHDLTEEGLAALETRPDLVIWPETAYQLAYLQEAHPLSQALDSMHEHWLKTHSDLSFVFGTYQYLSPHGQIQNAMVWADRGQVRGVYGKRRLLAWGEYLPFRDWLPASVAALWPYEDFVSGNQLPVWAVSDTLRILPSICYEILFDDTSHQAFQLDANVILNLTNDSWFVIGMAKELHLLMAKVRAAVTGLPVIRMTNTGISAVVNSWGQEIVRGKSDLPQVLSASVKVAKHPLRFPGAYYFQQLLGVFLWFWLGLMALRLRE
jgi:apolipoprotein N-acyltransferase